MSIKWWDRSIKSSFPCARLLSRPLEQTLLGEELPLNLALPFAREHAIYAIHHALSPHTLSPFPCGPVRALAPRFASGNGYCPESGQYARHKWCWCLGPSSLPVGQYSNFSPDQTTPPSSASAWGISEYFWGSSRVSGVLKGSDPRAHCPAPQHNLRPGPKFQPWPPDSKREGGCSLVAHKTLHPLSVEGILWVLGMLFFLLLERKLLKRRRPLRQERSEAAQPGVVFQGSLLSSLSVVYYKGHLNGGFSLLLLHKIPALPSRSTAAIVINRWLQLGRI